MNISNQTGGDRLFGVIIGLPSETRGTWSNQLEFVLTLIGFAVGLGNVWRFPYLCYKNGGGAFLIPYFICLVVIGIPMFYLEICLGQYASLGPLKVWRINPAFKVVSYFVMTDLMNISNKTGDGLGYAVVIVSGLIGLYYCVIIGWCLYFFFASMTSLLPWVTCNNYWNSCACRDGNQNDSLHDPWNGTRAECVNFKYSNETVNPSEDYWNNRVLEITDSLEDSGGVKWDITLCLLLAWGITFIVLSKGVKSLGKVVYFTAIFPYVLLTVLLVRGVTLEGSMDGIMYYLTPNFEKLADPNVWADAAGQIFFSLSSCQGGLLAMASYNKFNNNVLRDTFVIPVINCLTSFYGGFAIFSVLGFMAKSKGVAVDKVVASGPGLVFIVYPEGMAQMPVAPLWSVLFFFMMATLGFSSIFAITETVLTGFMDELTGILTTKWRVVGFRFAVCFAAFLLGLPMVTRGGYYLFDIVDTNVGGFPLLFTGLFEILSIIFIYGFKRFKKNIEQMIGKSLIVSISFVYFGLTWCILAPLSLLALIVMKAAQYKPIEGLSPLGEALGWGVVMFPLMFIPGWLIYYTCTHGVGRMCLDLNSPDENWKPAYEKEPISSLDTVIPVVTKDNKVGHSDDTDNKGYSHGSEVVEINNVRTLLYQKATDSKENVGNFAYENKGYGLDSDIGENSNHNTPNIQSVKL